MRYSGIIRNDIAAGEGVNVTLFVQGCPIHCPGCHNPETWDFNGGKEFTWETVEYIIHLLRDNGVQRNFSIMGGEPMAEQNVAIVADTIWKVRQVYPDIKVYLWTGYTYEELIQRKNVDVQSVLKQINVLVDGPFIAAERDITLPLRGSRNQRVLHLKGGNITYESKL